MQHLACLYIPTMAYKRSRATFEADLQAQQSPYVIYGSPLPPLDADTRDDGSYIPVWKQEVTDEQGRKRLHGAFTGGFSAGYFNTVGSKEGWTPSNFVSSRSNRNRDTPRSQRRPEDFMDEEDLAEAEEARKLQTTDVFAGLGNAEENASMSDSFIDLLRPTGDTMGVRLLKKMGWREGQGIGPKIRRKARLDETLGAETGATHWFALDNSDMIAFHSKNDRKGLGFEGEGSLPSYNDRKATQNEDFGDLDAKYGRSGSLKHGINVKQKKPVSRGGFGVGILNDDGSDDEDPYSVGPEMSYNRVIGADKKRKRKYGVNKPNSNPLLNSKPVFISKKSTANRANSGFQKCHDGRLPIEGFVLSPDADSISLALSQERKYPPPEVPEGWTSSKGQSAADSSDPTNFLSSAEVAAAAKLSPKSRSALLGETQLPGKSVFDFLTPSARSRIVSATNNQDLPPALSEGAKALTSSQSRTLQSLVPPLARETALTALARGTAGWMPYTEDPAKRARYRSFLELGASLRPEGALPDRAPGASNDEWAKEMDEFARAAEIFKPMTGMMTDRFTPSSSSPKMNCDNIKLEQGLDTERKPQLLAKPTSKTKTPAEEAAALGMYGPLTRSVENFYPTRLLCKRFNVQPPVHVQIDPGDPPVTANEGATAPPPSFPNALPQKRLELVGKKDMEDLKVSKIRMREVQFSSGGVQRGDAPEIKQEDKTEDMVIDPERNEAIEKDRPGEAVFKAIFGSDSEGD